MGNYLSSGLYEETEYKTTAGGVGYSIILEQPAKLMPLKLSKLAAERERYNQHYQKRFFAYYIVKFLFFASVFATAYFKVCEIIDEVSYWCLKLGLWLVQRSKTERFKMMNKFSLEQQGFSGISKVWSVAEKKLLIKNLNLQENTISDKLLWWQTKHSMNSAPLIQAVSKNEGSKRSDLEIDGFIDQKSGKIFQKIESEIKVEANVE